ncbi:MAG: cupin domain-containing protein [Pseudomonadales bacterium]|nr:cupin domain-containing protein [Pseudomonadales bacterium]
MSDNKPINDFIAKLSHPRFLGGMSAQEFLDNFWQQKPLLLHNAFPEQIHCISAEELAGFSLEESIESRIIIEQENNEWQLLNGPFNEDTFEQLPKQRWTLLIQAIDHYVSEFAELLDQFNFIPQWRIDDLMMSYATIGGSVGPHYDYYDVFLIQVSGQRRWQVGQLCDDATALLPNLPMRILKQFEQAQDHVLSPGDVLYLPPGVAHHGIALDNDCITLSVGFRAPSYSEILGEFSHYLAAKLSGDQRYQDRKLSARDRTQVHSGLITDNDVNNLHAQLAATLADKESLKEWLAHFLSLPKYEDTETLASDMDRETFKEHLTNSHRFQRDESSRFIVTQSNGATIFWINGTPQTVVAENVALVNYLSSRRVLDGQVLAELTDSEDKLEWLYNLLQNGYIYTTEDPND